MPDNAGWTYGHLHVPARARNLHNFTSKISVLRKSDFLFFACLQKDSLTVPVLVSLTQLLFESPVAHRVCPTPLQLFLSCPAPQN